jgi:hypothetical protein
MKVLKQSELYRLSIEDNGWARIDDLRIDDHRLIDSEPLIRELSDMTSYDFDDECMSLFNL